MDELRQACRWAGFTFGGGGRPRRRGPVCHLSTPPPTHPPPPPPPPPTHTHHTHTVPPGTCCPAHRPSPPRPPSPPPSRSGPVACAPPSGRALRSSCGASWQSGSTGPSTSGWLRVCVVGVGVVCVCVVGVGVVVGWGGGLAQVTRLCPAAHQRRPWRAFLLQPSLPALYLLSVHADAAPSAQASALLPAAAVAGFHRHAAPGAQPAGDGRAQPEVGGRCCCCARAGCVGPCWGRGGP